MIYGDIFRQRLTLINEHTVADTIDYLEMQFNFRTDDWDGLTKWAHFSKGGTVYDIPLTGDCIRKEDHLNLTAGEWSVYLHGNEFADGEVVERITTSAEVLRVFPTGSLEGEPFPEIPASETERILARLEKLEEGGGGGTGGTGTVTSVAGVAPDETGNVPLKPEDIGAADTKKVDELSKEIAEKVTTPATAEVGQMLVVETVDDTGKPLTWKVIPAPDLSAYLKKTGDTLAGKFVLPTGNVDVGFVNSLNTKIIGYSEESATDSETGETTTKTIFRTGDAAVPLRLRGSGSTPQYNGYPLLRETDVLRLCLPLAGGTMTGEIRFPAGNTDVGITNDADGKIFGYGVYNNVVHMRMGDVAYPLQFRGSGANPLYGGKTILLEGDVYSKDEINTALGNYINDVAALVGGDA